MEKTRSISKAAENLLMGQPNLSRAIKELEESLGVTLFNRTSKGMSPTLQGEEFVRHAKEILAQVYELEAMYRHRDSDKLMFSISVPRASYIGCAFTEFIKTIDDNRKAEIYYKETNSMCAIKNILEENYNLGIIRYQVGFKQHFETLFHERGLSWDILMEFSHRLIMSKEHPLASKKEIEMSDLSQYIEIAHADMYVPSLPLEDVRKAELSKSIDKRIFVFERGSQFDILSNVPNTFMWVSPIPKSLLNQYGLVEKKCVQENRLYRDVLVHRKDYYLTDLDREFIFQLETVKDSISH